MTDENQNPQEQTEKPDLAGDEPSQGIINELFIRMKALEGDMIELKEKAESFTSRVEKAMSKLFHPSQW